MNSQNYIKKTMLYIPSDIIRVLNMVCKAYQSLLQTVQTHFLFTTAELTYVPAD